MNRWRLISHEWAHSLSCTFSGLCSLLTTTSAFQYYTLSVPTSDSAQTNQPERNLGLQKLHKSIRFCLKRWAWRLYCTTDELRVDWAGSLRTGFPRDGGETLAPWTIWISLILNSRWNVIFPGCTGRIRIQCRATVGSVWMTTNVSLVLIWLADLLQSLDQTRPDCRISFTPNS